MSLLNRRSKMKRISPELDSMISDVSKRFEVDAVKASKIVAKLAQGDRIVFADRQRKRGRKKKRSIRDVLTEDITL